MQKFDQKCVLGFLHISILARTIQAKLDLIKVQNKFNEEKEKIGIFEQKWNQFKGTEIGEIIRGEGDNEFITDKMFFVQNLLEW